MYACGPIQLLSMKALPAKIAFKAGQEVIMIFYTKIDFFFLYKDSSLPFKIFVEGMEGNTIMATFPPFNFRNFPVKKGEEQQFTCKQERKRKRNSSKISWKFVAPPSLPLSPD